MHSDARTRLAAEQLELVRALVGHDAMPAEFDSSRIQATTEALLHKRSHSVARVWPALSRSLGETFEDRFARYARSRPLPEGGALADGRVFARTLCPLVSLADEAKLEVLAFDLHHRVRPDGAIARRGFSLVLGQLKESFRLVIAIRLPLLGERWIRVPLKIL
jgi:hypothetical protein